MEREDSKKTRRMSIFVWRGSKEMGYIAGEQRRDALKGSLMQKHSNRNAFNGNNDAPNAGQRVPSESVSRW